MQAPSDLTPGGDVFLVLDGCMKRNWNPGDPTRECVRARSWRVAHQASRLAPAVIDALRLVMRDAGAARRCIAVAAYHPFLLVAAACFERSSPRLQRWLFSNRLFGDALRRYRGGEDAATEQDGATCHALGAVGFSLWQLASSLWWLLLLLVCGAVTVHILRIPCSGGLNPGLHEAIRLTTRCG